MAVTQGIDIGLGGFLINLADLPALLSHSQRIIFYMIYYVKAYTCEVIRMPDYEEMYKPLFQSMTRDSNFTKEA